LARMIDDLGLTAMAEGQTHHSGTQIDNWLMTDTAAHTVGDSCVIPGVCGKDHAMVSVECVEAREGEGERRQRGVGDLFRPESKEKTEQKKIATFAEKMEAKYEEMGGEIGDDGGEEAEGEMERDWVSELERFQTACTRAAREVEAASKKQRKGGGATTKKEAKRASVGKWNRIAEQARRWNGKLKKGRRSWKQTTFAEIPQIAKDQKVQDTLEQGGNVKHAVLEVCDRELKRATTAFENGSGKKQQTHRKGRN